ncbi:MAG: SulP family inorganic anion transporter [Acidimicrobiia bacterium]|nr:SulP family inorganic anion transporter [Acidimicrobiia bacterium]MYC44199.1 SulP family inorganic anion transporter [Acidimicrobiia bacterium]MYI20991.1 SulP family inorganic anion transporter [Acidimicrobiia bacterium]
MRNLKGRIRYSRDDLRSDVLGGITAGVVGLPLALAFGEGSGLGAVAGLYAAVSMGLFAALFGGTQTLVSGPTAPMTVAVSVIVATQVESITEVFAIAVMAGILQILLGALRLGRFIAYTPYSVISGFMSGVGIIIILSQTLPFGGSAVAEGGPLGAIRAWPDLFGDLNTQAVVIGGVTLAVSIFWPVRLRRWLPATLAALIAGTLLSVGWGGDTPIIGDVPQGFPAIALPAFSVDLLGRAVQPAITLALLGSINTLLTSLMADSMTRTQHDSDRELIGQGVGNVATGFIAGMPSAGITVLTGANIRAGARTRVSAVLCAGILLAILLGLGRFLEVIPHAALAAILIRISWDIIDWRFLTRMKLIQREHLVVMATTLALTVFVDLLTAVAVGLVVAGMVGARRFELFQMDRAVSVPLLDQTFLYADVDLFDLDDDVDMFAARTGMVGLKGNFTVASSRRMIKALSQDIGEHEVVILDFSETQYIDDSAALVVEQMIDVARAEDTECIVMGLQGLPAETLQSLNVLRHIPPDHIVEDLDGAREVAKRLLDA